MIDLTNIEFYKNSDDNWKEIKYNNKIYKLKSLFEKNKDMKNIKLKNK